MPSNGRQSKGSDRDRIAALEAQVAELTRRSVQHKSRDAVVGAGMQVRLAKTASDSDPSSYPPEPANTYGIIFLNGTFAESMGDVTATFTDRQTAPATAYAHYEGDEYFPIGTKVWVVRLNGRWWILGPADLESGGGASMVYFALNSDLSTSTGSVYVTVLRTDVGDTPSSPLLVKNQPASDSTYVFSAAAGARGPAYQDDNGDWWILWVVCSDDTVGPQESYFMSPETNPDAPQGPYGNAQFPGLDPFAVEQSTQQQPYFETAVLF